EIIYMNMYNSIIEYKKTNQTRTKLVSKPGRNKYCDIFLKKIILLRKNVRDDTKKVNTHTIILSLDIVTKFVSVFYSFLDFRQGSYRIVMTTRWLASTLGLLNCVWFMTNIGNIHSTNKKNEKITI
ncbi:hypothetical protein ACJX0J_021733, partial [Zea mays]